LGRVSCYSFELLEFQSSSYTNRGTTSAGRGGATRAWINISIILVQGAYYSISHEHGHDTGRPLVMRMKYRMKKPEGIFIVNA
jgi:hypothetical protein